jgi:hypothetical protein
VRPRGDGRRATVLVAETGSLGVRGSVIERWPQRRSETTVDVAGVDVRVKVADGRVKVEHDDAAVAAERLGLPLRDGAPARRNGRRHDRAGAVASRPRGHDPGQPRRLEAAERRRAAPRRQLQRRRRPARRARRRERCRQVDAAAARSAGSRHPRPARSRSTAARGDAPARRHGRPHRGRRAHRARPVGVRRTAAHPQAAPRSRPPSERAPSTRADALRHARSPTGATPAGTTIEVLWDECTGRCARHRPAPRRRPAAHHVERRRAEAPGPRGAPARRHDVLVLDEPDNFLDVPGKRVARARAAASPARRSSTSATTASCWPPPPPRSSPSRPGRVDPRRGFATATTTPARHHLERVAHEDPPSTTRSAAARGARGRDAPAGEDQRDVRPQAEGRREPAAPVRRAQPSARAGARAVASTCACAAHAPASAR